MNLTEMILTAITFGPSKGDERCDEEFSRLRQGDRLYLDLIDLYKRLAEGRMTESSTIDYVKNSIKENDITISILNRPYGEHGGTVLHQVAQAKSYETFNYFLQKGVHPFARDKRGITALRSFIIQHHTLEKELIKLAQEKPCLNLECREDVAFGLRRIIQDCFFNRQPFTSTAQLVAPRGWVLYTAEEKEFSTEYAYLPEECIDQWVEKQNSLALSDTQLLMCYVTDTSLRQNIIMVQKPLVTLILEYNIENGLQYLLKKGRLGDERSKLYSDALDHNHAALAILLVEKHPDLLNVQGEKTGRGILHLMIKALESSFDKNKLLVSVPESDKKLQDIILFQDCKKLYKTLLSLLTKGAKPNIQDYLLENTAMHDLGALSNKISYTSFFHWRGMFYETLRTHGADPTITNKTGNVPNEHFNQSSIIKNQQRALERYSRGP